MLRLYGAIAALRHRRRRDRGLARRAHLQDPPRRAALDARLSRWSNRRRSRPSASARGRPPSSAPCSSASASTSWNSCARPRRPSSSASAIATGGASASPMTGRSTTRTRSCRRRPARPSEYLNVYSVAAGRPVSEMHLFAHLMERRKSPYGRKADGSLIPVGPFHYAYHFDQALVGRYLRKKSSGIAQVDGTVAGIEKDPETGDITALKLEEGGSRRRRLLHRRHRIPQAADRRRRWAARGTPTAPSCRSTAPCPSGSTSKRARRSRPIRSPGRARPAGCGRSRRRRATAAATSIPTRSRRRTRPRPRSRRRSAGRSSRATTSASTSAGSSAPGSAIASRSGSPPASSSRWRRPPSTAPSCRC